MTNKDLAEVIFPNITHDITFYENKYPKRNLENDAKVTRFAPSPTGFVHIGNFLGVLIDYFLAKTSNGVFYLRNEDTDTKREVDTAVDKIMDVLNYVEFLPQEYEYKDKVVGNYGPYIQSERIEIYHTFIKHLIEIGRAYPCFCSSEELDLMRKRQEAKKSRLGYYGGWAKCRDLSNEERIKRIKNGEEYVIRFKSMGNFNRKFQFDDLVTGTIEFPENDLDIIIMKSGDLLPTYHFAHVVDDHLMRTTHVVRGQEWLSSVPIHIELFKAFDFEPPKYIHNVLLLKQEDGIRRKISKRKDPEALMGYYIDKGYPKEAVIESLMTILNSNYEEWRTANPDASYLEFDFNPKKMSTSGALYDLDKLDNISKNYLSKLSAKEIYENLLKYTEIYNPEFNSILKKYKDYSIQILNIEREQKKPRKDFATYSDILPHIWYMFDEYFDTYEKNYEYQNITDKEEIKNILLNYLEIYSVDDDKDTWFNKIKELCDKLGYASNMKEYKQNPENFKGNIADVSTVLRVSLTTKHQTPDLYEIMRLLGKEKIEERYKKICG